MTTTMREGAYGFTDLKVFNKAFLASTTSSTLNEQHAMWVKVIKGIYYLNSEFLHATKESRASWCWSSLLSGRDVIRDDEVWSIGHGHSVRTFVDRWVSTHPGFSISHTTPGNITRQNVTLDAWINCEHRQWIEDIVRLELPHAEAE